MRWLCWFGIHKWKLKYNTINMTGVADVPDGTLLVLNGVEG